MLVLNEQLKNLLVQHQDLDARITAHEGARFPDRDEIKRLKKEKLAVKDQMERLSAELPASAYAPINPSLYPLSDAELDAKLTAKQNERQRLSQHKNPTSSDLSKLDSEIRTIQLEIDRREWESVVPPPIDEQVEMSLVASG